MQHTANHKIKQLAWLISIANAKKLLAGPDEFHWERTESIDFHELRQNWHSIFYSGNAIRDIEVLNYIKQIELSNYLYDVDICAKFEDKFQQWISTGNGYYKISGLDAFPISQTVNGSQEAFNHFYVRHRNSRFRMHRGEFWWHMEALDILGLHWRYIEDDDLKPGDVVLLSMPFTFNSQAKFNTLDQCNKHNIPVLLDLIYLPNALECMHIDVDQPCIQEVTTSLSKTFPVQCGKVGVRFCRQRPADPLSISADENVNNRFSAGLGYSIMQQYDCNYMPNKYKKLQSYWCKELDLQESNILQFAYGEPVTDKHSFSKYNQQNHRFNLRFFYENHNWLVECLQKI